MLQKKNIIIVHATCLGACSFVRQHAFTVLAECGLAGDFEIVRSREPIDDDYILAHTAAVWILRPFLEEHAAIIEHYRRRRGKHKFRLFWALMAFAGLRHAEALSFGSSSIVDGRLRIVGKGNKEAFVPIGKRLEDELGRVEVSDGMFAGKRFRTSERCMMHLRRAVKACGLDPADATNHKFRHSFASNLIRSGANVKAVQQLMRHESVDITLDTYSHLLQDDLKASVDIL